MKERKNCQVYYNSENEYTRKIILKIEDEKKIQTTKIGVKSKENKIQIEILTEKYEKKELIFHQYFD